MEQHFKTEWHGLVACFRAKLQAGGAQTVFRRSIQDIQPVVSGGGI